MMNKYVCIKELQPQYCKVEDVIFIDLERTYIYNMFAFFDMNMAFIDYLAMREIKEYFIPFAKYRENRINEILN